MKREHHPPHAYENGASYFLTASTKGHGPLLNTGEKRTTLCTTLHACARRLEVKIYAWVALEDHYHVLLQVGETSPLYKFVRALHSQSAQRINGMDDARGRQVWYQYWDRNVRSATAFWAYFNYIHINPLKHGYVQVSGDAITVAGNAVRIPPKRRTDVHEALAAYRHSSYPVYLQRRGVEFLMDAWLRYPIPHQMGVEP